MSSSVVLNVLGTAVEIQGPGAMIDRVSRQWSRCVAEGRPATTLELHEQLDADVREYQLASGLNLLGIQNASQRLNLHAAGLSDATGLVAALVAPSGTGKTTAARVLGANLGYVTDECVSIDPLTHQVLPYPKPLSIVVDPESPDAKEQVSPDDLHLQHVPASLTLGAILLLSREPRDSPVLEPAPLLEVVQALMTQVSGLGGLHSPMRKLAELVTRAGGAQWLRYAEIAECEPLVRSALTRRELRVERYEHVPGLADVHVPGPCLVGGHDDAIRTSAGALLLIEQQLIMLSGPAVHLWALAAVPARESVLRAEADALGLEDSAFSALLSDLTQVGALKSC